jgi:hypothetical protein
MSNTIVVDILADTRSLVRGVNETNSKLNSLNGSVSKISGAFKGLLATFGLSIGINWFKDAIKAAEDEEKSFAALAKEYGTAADEVIAKVNGISKKFYVDDGTIAQLIVDLRGKLRAELDPLAVDLAAGTINLARVMNQPIEEMSAKMQKVVKDGKVTMLELQQLGVSLNVEQQKSFDAAVKSGTTVQWLTDYLTSPEYQKKALSMITPYDKLNFTLNEIKDLVGGKLLKAFEGLFEFFTDTDKNGVTRMNGNFKDMKDILLLIGTALLVSKIVTPILLWTKAVQGLTLSNIALNIVMNANPIGLIILGITALIAIVILIRNHWDELGRVFSAVGGVILSAFRGVKDFFVTLFRDIDLLPPIKQMISNVTGFLRGLGSTFYGIGKDIIQGLINGIGNMIGSAVQAVKNVASAISNGIKNVLGINSPSRVFMGFGAGVVEGLVMGIDKNAYQAVSSVKDLGNNLSMDPMTFSGSAYSAGASKAQTINVTINAGLGTDSYELGRVVSAALDKYSGVNGR